MTTKITPSVLDNTAVTTGTYGGASTIPVYTVDAQGRITSSANITPVIATTLLSGTISAAQLAATTVSATSVGSASSVPRFTVDAQGRLTSANSIAIAISSGAVSGLAASATTDTTNADNISSGTLPAARLPTSGVVPLNTANTSTGSANSVSRFTVDSTGRITSANSIAISISTSQISNFPALATSATTDTSNATNISSGTLASARLPSIAGLTAAAYGSATAVPQVTVDTTGRVTAITTVNIGIGAAAVSGLSTVATSGAYTDLSGRPTLATVATSGSYTDLTGRPTLATVATSGSYTDLTGKPTLATVATSGSYTDLTGRPTTVSSFTNDAEYYSGKNAAWYNRTGSRVLDTTYTNTSGKIMFLSISGVLSPSSIVDLQVSGVTIAQFGTANDNARTQLFAVVPKGATYRLATTGGIAMALAQWFEFV